METNNTYLELFCKITHCNVKVYKLFDNKTALIFDPRQAGRCKGNGWQIVAMKNLIPLEYVTDEMFMSKTEKNKIKERLTLTQATWTCTDGVDFDDCEKAIIHERDLMAAEEVKNHDI